MTSARIGIDLGGTKIEGLVLDPEGRELARRRVPSPSADYGAILGTISGLVSGLEADTGRTGTVGVAMPGAISPASGVVKNSNTLALNGRPFNRDLAAALGRPVRVANDANCFAMSEATDGAAAGAHVAFGVILGTGVGGGIVIGGRLLTGADAVAGEWGHNPLPRPEAGEWPGPPCYCGKRGCIETFLCGPALAADGGFPTARALADAAGAGDLGAEAALQRYERRLARALAHVVNLIDPDVIVLGGGLSQLGRLYDSVPALIAAAVFSDRLVARLVPPRHGDSSGVRGAAWLWPADPAAREEPISRTAGQD